MELFVIEHNKDPFVRWFNRVTILFCLLGLLLFGVTKCINHFSPPPTPPNTQAQPTGPKAAS